MRRLLVPLVLFSLLATCSCQSSEHRFRVACQLGYVNLVNKLLDEGADPNAHTAQGWTPLMWAAAEGHDGVVRVLLQRGANPEIRNRWGQDAAAVARQQGHSDIADLLTVSRPGRPPASTH